MAVARATVVLLRSVPTERLVRLVAIGSSVVVAAVVTHAHIEEAPPIPAGVRFSHWDGKSAAANGTLPPVLLEMCAT